MTLTGRSVISADDLGLLNEELRALARAGVPLEPGLRGLSERAGGPLGRASARLADRVAAGVDIQTALADESHVLPHSYAAIVRAGVEAGRLPVALESLTSYSALLRELRQHFLRALIYPAALLVIGYLLFLFFISQIAPRLESMYQSFDLADAWWRGPMRFLIQTFNTWWLAVPVVVGTLLLLGWLIRPQLGDSQRGRGTDGLGLLAWVPGFGGLLRDYRLALFSKMAALLVASEVPLPEALRLSGEASGSARLSATARQMSDRIEAGEPIERAVFGLGVPAMLRWLMITGAQHERLAVSFEQAADVYQHRMVRKARLYAYLFPILITILLGATLVLGYALMLFIPMTELLEGLSRPL